MTSDAPAKPAVRFPAETWAKIKAEACGGASYPSLSLRYGPSPQVIANKAKFEQWPTPKRLALLRKEMGETGKSGGVASGQSRSAKRPAPAPDNADDSNDRLSTRPPNHDTNVVSRFHAALLALVDSPPSDFQQAFAAVAQAAIAEGVRDVPAPRSIKELATWFDLWRKAAGLDAKQGQTGPAPLVNPLRTVSRRSGAVVDVDPVDVAPVPGSADWGAWEV